MNRINPVVPPLPAIPGPVPVAVAECKEVEVLCPLCGKPVRISLPTDPMFKRLSEAAMARGVVHEACLEAKKKNDEDEALKSKLERRARNWLEICPRFYQGSEQWVRSDAAKRKLNMIAVKLALEWAYGEKGVVLFGAQSGTGKTTSAWLLVRREFNEGRFVIAMSHSELSEAATRVAMGENAKWAKLVRQCDLLMIDDLGKSRFTTVNGSGRASEEFLFELFDCRARNCLPTVFTCNLNGDGIRTEMSAERGERFVRRLREFCVSISFDKVARVKP